MRRSITSSLVIAVGVSALVAISPGQAGRAAPLTAARSTAKSATPVRGGTITIAVDADPAGFDPAKDSIPSPGADSIVRSILDTVVVPGNVVGYKPYLARSLTPNKNGSVWTIKLRPGLRFSDGTPLNAAAIKYNFERMNKVGFAGKNTWPSLKRVDVVNNLTARVILKYPDGAFPVELYSQDGTLGSPTAFKKEGSGFSNHPVGSGAYELSSWTHGNEVVLTRNPYYWKKPYPFFNKVIFRIIPSQAASLAALKAHSVDAAEIDPAQGTALHDAGYTVRAGTFGTTDLALNSSVPPLNDIRVRRAIVAAINNAAIVKTAYNGVGPVTNVLAPPGNPFHIKLAGYGYDPAKAQQLVAQYKAATGQAPSFQISEANDPQSELFAQIAQQELQAVGMNVTLSQPLDPNAMISQVLGLKYQVATDALPEGLDPGVWWPIIFASKSAGGIENFYGYSNPTIDKALKIAHETTNLMLEKKEYGIVQQQVAANAYTVPIRGVVYAEAYAPNIQGANSWRLPDGSIQAWGQDYRIPFRVDSLWRSR